MTPGYSGVTPRAPPAGYSGATLRYLGASPGTSDGGRGARPEEAIRDRTRPDGIVIVVVFVAVCILIITVTI